MPDRQAQQALIKSLQPGHEAATETHAAGRSSPGKAQQQRNQGQRDQQRRQQCQCHGQGERHEEQSRQAPDKQQWQKHRHRGYRTGDVRACNVLKPPPNASPVVIALLPAMIDALQHDNGVISQQPDSYRERPQGHQIQRLVQRIKSGNSEQQRQRNTERQHPDPAARPQDPEQHPDRQQCAQCQVPAQVGADQARPDGPGCRCAPSSHRAGSSLRAAASVVRISRVTGTVEAPGCLNTVTAMLGRPSRLTLTRVGNGARTIRARSCSGTGPCGAGIGVSARAAVVLGNARSSITTS